MRNGSRGSTRAAIDRNWSVIAAADRGEQSVCSVSRSHPLCSTWPRNCASSEVPTGHTWPWSEQSFQQLMEPHDFVAADSISDNLVPNMAVETSCWRCCWSRGRLDPRLRNQPCVDQIEVELHSTDGVTHPFGCRWIRQVCRIGCANNPRNWQVR